MLDKRMTKMLVVRNIGSRGTTIIFPIKNESGKKLK